jgi:hypothetical protein
VTSFYYGDTAGLQFGERSEIRGGVRVVPDVAAFIRDYLLASPHGVRLWLIRPMLARID